MCWNDIVVLSPHTETFAPTSRDMPSQNKVLGVCMCRRIQISSPKRAAERSATRFISQRTHVWLLGFWIKSRDRRCIFLFDLLPNYSSAGTTGMKSSLKILTPDTFCLVKTPAATRALKPRPPGPAKGHLWIRLWRGKGQHPKSTSKWSHGS